MKRRGAASTPYHQATRTSLLRPDDCASHPYTASQPPPGRYFPQPRVPEGSSMLDAIVLGAIVLAGTPDVTLTDRVALLRIGTGQQQKPLSVFSHGITPGSADCVGSAFATDPKILALS